MFDLHSHLLPDMDDGAADVETSLVMARAYVDQGVQYVACTPHILPGLYHNTGSQIRQAVAHMQTRLDDAGIPLKLLTGADNHMVPDFSARLREGCLLTLADSPYVLVEPPHHVAPARLEGFFFDLLIAGYIPILTHPERLSWIESKYDLIKRLASRGVWMQITAGSLRGRFGRRARYWSERLLADGVVHILASDAHNTTTRPPDLLEGRREVERRAGVEEAERLVLTRPSLVLAKPLAASASEKASEGRGRYDHSAQTTAAYSGGGCAGRMFGIFSQ